MRKWLKRVVIFVFILGVVFLASQTWSIRQTRKAPGIESAKVMLTAGSETLRPDEFRAAGFTALKRIQENPQTSDLKVASDILSEGSQNWADTVLQTEIRAVVVTPTAEELNYYKSAMWGLFCQAAPEFLRELLPSVVVSLVLSAWGNVSTNRKKKTKK